MWSIHVVPNNGTAYLASEEQYQTHVKERKRNVRRGWGGEGGFMPKPFEAKIGPVMSVIE